MYATVTASLTVNPDGRRKSGSGDTPFLGTIGRSASSITSSSINHDQSRAKCSKKRPGKWPLGSQLSSISFFSVTSSSACQDSSSRASPKPTSLSTLSLHKSGMGTGSIGSNRPLSIMLEKHLSTESEKPLSSESEKPLSSFSGPPMSPPILIVSPDIGGGCYC